MQPEPTQKKPKENTKEKGNGSGSVYQRGSKWCWQLTVYQGLKRTTVSGTCNNRTEARAELAKAIAKRENGGLIAPDKMTLGEWLDYWLEGKKAKLSPSTYVSYENNVRVHLKPGLGHIKLQALKPVHLKTFYSDLAKKPVRLSGRGKRKEGRPHPTKLLSEKTQAYAHSVLHGALEEAYRLELIVRNPADIVKPEVKQEARNVRASTAWTAEEAAIFLAFAKGDRFYEMFYLLLALGLRRGEMLGLRWSNIDLTLGRMKIVETVNSVRGKIVIGTPKTQKSRRTLKLPSDVVALLVAHQEKQRLEHLALNITSEKDWIFTSLAGTPVNPHKIDDAFYRIITKARVRKIRVHDLRHSHASLARRQGVSLEVVSERLGHARASFTADVYRHTFEDEMDAGAISLDKLLAPRALPN